MKDMEDVMEDVGKVERREVEGIYQGVVWSTVPTYSSGGSCLYYQVPGT